MLDDKAWKLAGQTVLVTGASSGIGRAASQALAERGGRIILVGRDEARLQETAATLPGSGHAVEAFDLLNFEGLTAWMKELVSRHGALSGLVHSAGVFALQPARMSTVKTWEKVFKVNVLAAGQLMAAFRQPGNAAKPAQVVLVSSVAGLAGEPGISAYSASKGAIVSLTRSLAMELAADGVRVNCVAPGQVATPMMEQSQKFLSPEQVAAIAANHPLGIGQPEDVANAIAFLMMPSSRWITGTTLVVDGGYTAH